MTLIVRSRHLPLAHALTAVTARTGHMVMWGRPIALFVALGSLALGTDAYANCVTTGSTTVCDTSSPNPFTSQVGAGNSAAGDNQTVTVDPGATISSGNASAISLRDNATITVNGVVQNYATNSSGGFNTGGNTIEFRNNGTLTIGSGGQILSNGPQVSSEAINVQGSGNTITNNGLINSATGAAIWSQNAGTLTIVNNGTISTGPINNPSRTATVIGGNTNAGIDFTNRGLVYGSLNLGSGADTLRLYTGSIITGNFSGGGGVDSIYLNGTGVDSLSGTMTGFEYLYKQDAGIWTLSGSISGLIAANVQAGTLILTGNNSGFTGTTSVSAGATLQGRAQSLPNTISNDGLVRFAQIDAGEFSGLISGAGGVEKSEAGTLTISSAQTYTGTTAINAGTLLLTGSLASPTTIASGATLAGTGTINGAVTNAGILAPGLGTSAGAFTIVGNYTSNNGVLATNIWGTPAAPQADRLVVSGNGSVASGTTQILATDRGGLGAPTTGDGIVIVSAQNGAVTQAGAFTLGQRVAAGAYEYSLHRGGSSAGSGQNWYLRTTIDPATSSGGAMPQPLPPADPNTTTPAAPVSATAEVTNYRVETAVYPGLQVAQRLYTYSLVDTLDQRRGSLSAQTPGAASVPGGWGRVAGVLGSTRVGEMVGPNLSYNYGFLQTGLDLFAGQTTTGGVQFAGVFVAVGQSSATTATASRGQTGQFGSNAYTVGLYATRFEANGLYADGLLQATRFAQSKANSVGGASLATDGWSGSASLEAGWRMGLAQHFYVVPQLQIVGDTFALNNATDAYGLMEFQNQTALRGRIGLLGGATFNGDQPERAVNVWLRASAWNVFAGGPKTSFETFAGTNGVIFQSHYGSSWLGLDGGVTAQLSKQSALYANAGYDYGFGLARQAFTGRIGLQAQW